MANELKILHDKLLAERPEGVTHEKDSCPLCAIDSLITEENINSPEGGNVSEGKTYTEAELNAKVEAATSGLVAKLAELEGSQKQSEVDKALNEAKAQADAKINELQASLDAAVVEATKAKEDKAAVEQFWAEAIAEDTKNKEIASRKEERLVKIAEVASLPEKYLEDNADRFAAMSEEDFVARLEEWKVIAAKTEDIIPKKTALTAAREDGGDSSNTNGSMLGEIAGMRRHLVDPRTL